MSRKTIIFSNYDDRQNPWYGGGGARAIHALARLLSREFDITVITGTYPGARHEEVIDGVRYQRIGLSFLGPRLGQLAYSLFLLKQVWCRQYDLWIDSFTPPFGVSLIPLIASKPVIGVIHMLPGKDMWRKYRLPLHLVERIGLKWYRQLIVLTDTAKAEVERFVSQHTTVTVIPNGIVVPVLPAHREKRHILFLGRIEVDQKGIDLLLTAYDTIASRTTYPLVVAGGGLESEMLKLRQLISKMQQSRRVRLAGWVEGAAWEQLFLEAALVVIPSRFETFSLTALEALSYGVPVACFDVPGLSAISSDHVWKAKPFDAASLSEAMLAALDTERDAAFFQSAARPYSWDMVAERYRAVIDKCI